jgi:hypothetical protein
METDQIQKVLYEKSDVETKERVRKTLETLNTWRNGHGSCKIRIPVGAGDVFNRDGTPLRFMAGDVKETAADVHNKVRYASLEISLGNLVPEIEKYMILHVQPHDRVAFVKNFIAEVENLRATADELADRVSDVERHQENQ